jgi:hypothetical protein
MMFPRSFEGFIADLRWALFPFTAVIARPGLYGSVRKESDASLIAIGTSRGSQT